MYYIQVCPARMPGRKASPDVPEKLTDFGQASPDGPEKLPDFGQVRRKAGEKNTQVDYKPKTPGITM